MRRPGYAAFIHSAEWAVIRKKAFIRARLRCQDCGGGGKLHCHHVDYSRFGGQELPSDLRVLCEDCHNETHGGKAHPKRRGSKADRRRRTVRQAKGLPVPRQTDRPRDGWGVTSDPALAEIRARVEFHAERGALPKDLREFAKRR